MSYDDFDLKILRLVQENADISMAELGDRVGLSHTPCWRRYKKLESEGVINKKVSLLNARKLNLGVTVYAYIKIKKHDETSLNAFESAVQKVSNIVECYSTSGDKDYVIRVIVSSVEHYEHLLKKILVHLPNLDSINSTFSLKEVKYTTELPI